MQKRSIAIAGGIAATLVVASVGGLLLFGGSDEGASTSITQAATTSTTAATTTTTPTTSTSAAPTSTTRPGVDIILSLDGNGLLQSAAEAFYAWLGDPDGAEPPPMAEGLAAFLADIAPE